MASECLILTKNYVIADDTITVSHADAVKSYLYDRDKDSKWLSSGANNDATQISIEVVFKEGATAVNRAIDKLLLINHNLKTWNFDYWTGSAWTTLASESADAAATTYKSFSQVTTSKVRLLATATQTVNAEKYLGELIVAAVQVTPARDPEILEPRYRERSVEFPMGDGSEHKQVTRWTPNRTQKYGARVVFRLVSEAERLLLKAVCEARAKFLWYPEKTQRPDEIFLVRWSSPWSERYVNTYKGAGSEVSMDLKEV
jgi:hypothetical protein